jgi:hypothetical protein
VAEKIKRVSAMPHGTRVHPDFDPTNRMDGVRRLTPYTESGELVECVVQNGRTVMCPSPSGEKRIAGFDAAKGEYTYCLVEQSFGPGCHIQLRQSEYERLRSLDFVCHPDDFKELPPPKEGEPRRFGPEPNPA